MITRRSFATLIELLVALSLMATLLTTLFFFYREMNRMQHTMQQIERENFRILYVQKRLADTLARARVKSGFETGVFFTSPPIQSLFRGESLVFTYDNGVDLQKELSNMVLGRLFVNHEGKLMLVTWPYQLQGDAGYLPEAKPEILLEEVDQLHFSFFIPPKSEKKIDPKGAWKNEWNKDDAALPAILRIEILMQSKDSMQFSFPLIYAKEPVILNL